MTRSIRDGLIGGWVLLSCTAETPDGRTIFPRGEGFEGRLLYSADGLVGVNLADARRVRADPQTSLMDLDDSASGPLARSYLGYSGVFTVAEETHIVTHNFDLCLDPGLIGSLQERHVHFADDESLELTVPHFQRAAMDVAVSLKWRRHHLAK